MTAEQYLKDHGLNPEYVKESLGWNWDKDKITIPIYDKSGDKLFEKYRHLTGDVKFTFEKGGKPTLYPHWLVEDEQTLYLCEGETDAAKLWQEGLPAVTSIGGVESFDEHMAAELAGKTIKLVLDNDDAGQSSIPKYVSQLEATGAKIEIINLPPDTKDVSDYIVKYGVSRFKDLSATDPETWLINKYSTIYPIIDNKEFLSYDYPAKKWLIKPLMRASGIVFVVGEGGVGKTLISYSMAKAITEGRDWLDKYESTQEKVLILDKENDEIDIKENLYAQQATSENIFHYTAARNFSFFDDRGNPSEEALYLNAYIKKNNIKVVIMDSMVDFFVGNENDAVDAANNTLAWKLTFPDTAIIVLQHENKPQQGNGTRYSGHRVRGSTHIVNVAQSILSFSIPDREYPEQILVEHTKVRGAKKQNPFQIEMNIEPKLDQDGNDTQETIVTGFTYKGEVQMKKKAEDQAISAIINLLSDQPNRKFISKDIEVELSDQDISVRAIKKVLPKMRSQRLLAYDVDSMPYSYWYLRDQEENE